MKHILTQYLAAIKAREKTREEFENAARVYAENTDPLPYSELDKATQKHLEADFAVKSLANVRIPRIGMPVQIGINDRCMVISDVTVDGVVCIPYSEGIRPELTYTFDEWREAAPKFNHEHAVTLTSYIVSLTCEESV